MSKRQSFPFMIGIGLAVISLIIACLGFSYQHLNERFAREGVPANAVVLVKKLEQNHDSDNRYLLQLGYKDGQQKDANGWVAIPETMWNGMSEGQSVAVSYLKSEPATVRLDAPGMNPDGQVQLKLATIGGVCALLCLGLWWRKRRTLDSPPAT